jgi:hypothetical protein
LAHLTTVDPALVAALDEAVIAAVVAVWQFGCTRDRTAPRRAVRIRVGEIG